MEFFNRKGSLDCIEQIIKRVKLKYFSIDSYSDMSDASRELSLLVNKTRRYKDIFGSIYKFDLDGFNSGVELTDFLMFLILLAMRVNGFSKESISIIEANENMRKYLVSPKCYEFQLNDHVNKQLSELIVKHIKKNLK